MSPDIGETSMLDLFRVEAETRSKVFITGLTELGPSPTPEALAALGREIQGVRSAAGIVGLGPAVSLARAIEGLCDALSRGEAAWGETADDALKGGAKILAGAGEVAPEKIPDWFEERAGELAAIEAALAAAASAEAAPVSPPAEPASEPAPEPTREPEDLGDFSMLELFRQEAETQGRTLDNGLVLLEKDASREAVEPLMRAAHSLKGAARIVGLGPAVTLAHAMEDVLSAAMKGELALSAEGIDALLAANDIFLNMADTPAGELGGFLAERGEELQGLTSGLEKAAKPGAAPKPAESALESEPAPAAPDLADFSMLELFRQEAETQARLLDNGLVLLDKDASSEAVEPLMRAAHSLKGAARIVGLDPAVTLAHAMEDVLSAAMKGELALSADGVDVLLAGNDVFLKASEMEGEAISGWLGGIAAELDALRQGLAKVLAGEAPAAPVKPPKPEPTPVPEAPEAHAAPEPAPPAPKASKPPRTQAESVVRVSGETLSRVMGLAGETLIEARRLEPLGSGLIALKKELMGAMSALEQVRRLGGGHGAGAGEEYGLALDKAGRAIEGMRESLAGHTLEFEGFSRRLELLADRLYNEVISSRMRPFGDGLHGFARMIRGLARELGKQVEFTVRGEETRVDRDILERLEAPLNHLLRNAIDHGLETPEERRRAGKPEAAGLVLDARHRSGMLHISVIDDGRGIDPESIRAKVVERGLAPAELAARLTIPELMDFLFLPGFSTAKSLTEISGRGVGLDIVQSMVHEVGGSVSAESEPGKGTRFLLRLPLTLSVIRTLLIEVGGEPFAVPLTRIDRVVKAEPGDIRALEDKQYLTLGEDNIGLVDARQLFGVQAEERPAGPLCVVVVSDRMNRYGLVADAFLGERDLVVKPLDERLGKVPNLSAAAVLSDGTPVLILDVDDLVRSVDAILTQGRLTKVGAGKARVRRAAKRVLVVDDSLTVREMQRRLLRAKGYEVAVAVDGIDGLNAALSEEFDLVVTDVDMPRLGGIELIRRMRAEPSLAGLPVMVVSYKDREEDRLKGLEAGADYYLTKSSFEDESYVAAVRDLIGDA